MIDYLKIHSLPVMPEALLNNPLLTFTLSNVSTDGEVLNRWQIAHYNTLAFKIKGNNSKLAGSLHRYKQDGTNWQDFNLFDIQDTVQELAGTFEFEPEKACINFIEVGVNIPMDYSPTRLIECFVLYRNTPFDKMKVIGKGYGKVADTENFDIKVYNKSLQYGLPDHLLRFEIKVKKMRFLERYGIDGLNLADLTRPDIYPKFKSMLLGLLSGILIYSPDIDPDNITTLQDRELFKLGQFAEYWQRLERRRKNEKLRRFAELAGSDGIKEILKCKISDKWEILSNPDNITTFENGNNPDNITTFQKELNKSEPDKSGQYHPTINSDIVLRCIVTGLLIQNQRPGTKYISPKGMKWYYDNDPETYKHSLKSLLTIKWLLRHAGEPEEVFFTEIYHQIRNKGLNPKHNIKRDLLNLKNKGPKLFPTIEFLPPEKLRLIKNELIEV